jgi:hypothetical protein
MSEIKPLKLAKSPFDSDSEASDNESSTKTTTIKTEQIVTTNVVQPVEEKKVEISNDSPALSNIKKMYEKAHKEEEEEHENSSDSDSYDGKIHHSIQHAILTHSKTEKLIPTSIRAAALHYGLDDPSSEEDREEFFPIMSGEYRHTDYHRDGDDDEEEDEDEENDEDEKQHVDKEKKPKNEKNTGKTEESESSSSSDEEDVVFNESKKRSDWTKLINEHAPDLHHVTLDMSTGMYKDKTTACRESCSYASCGTDSEQIRKKKEISNRINEFKRRGTKEIRVNPEIFDETKSTFMLSSIHRLIKGYVNPLKPPAERDASKKFKPKDPRVKEIIIGGPTDIPIKNINLVLTPFVDTEIVETNVNGKIEKTTKKVAKFKCHITRESMFTLFETHANRENITRHRSNYELTPYCILYTCRVIDVNLTSVPAKFGEMCVEIQCCSESNPVKFSNYTQTVYTTTKDEKGIEVQVPKVLGGCLVNAGEKNDLFGSATLVTKKLDGRKIKRFTNVIYGGDVHKCHLNHIITWFNCPRDPWSDPKMQGQFEMSKKIPENVNVMIQTEESAVNGRASNIFSYWLFEEYFRRRRNHLLHMILEKIPDYQWSYELPEEKWATSIKPVSMSNSPIRVNPKEENDRHYLINSLSVNKDHVTRHWNHFLDDIRDMSIMSIEDGLDLILTPVVPIDPKDPAFDTKYYASFQLELVTDHIFQYKNKA